MDWREVSVIIIAVLVAVLSARIACWACLRLYSFDRGHWVVKSWPWTPVFAVIVFFIRPVYTDKLYAELIFNTFIDVAVYLPTCMVLTTLMLGAFSKARASYRANVPDSKNRGCEH